jgi:hypothetical protein
MMAITTSNSTSVNALRTRVEDMKSPFDKADDDLALSQFLPKEPTPLGDRATP